MIPRPRQIGRFGGHFAAALALPLLLAGCAAIKSVHRTTVPPSRAAALPQNAPFLKSHMRDGSLYVLSNWAVTTGDSTVRGEGRHFDQARRPLSAGTYRIPLDSVALFEANVVQTSSAVGAYSVLTAVTAIGAIVCITNPKACFGSCPTFYADDDTTTVQAEAFSSSVAPSLEATDVDALYRVHPRSPSLRLRMTNEAFETHVVRYVDLLAVAHGDGERVGRTPEGEFRRFRDPVPPAHVVGAGRAPGGDAAVGLLAAFDGRERFSLADSNDLAARESIELEFPARDDPAPMGFLIAARQTLMTTYLYYQTLAYLGRGAGDWLAMLERSGGAGRSLVEGIGRRLGTIDVAVPDSSGGWRRAGCVGETGPIATDVYLVPLPERAPSTAGRDRGPVRVRLEMTKGMWRIDHAALVSLGEAATADRIVATEVRRDGVVCPEALRSLIRRDDPIVALPGDVYTLVYPLPASPERYEYFLEARGWYLEWLREEWMKEENGAYARQAFLDPSGALRRLAPEFKAAEPRLEGLFWSSRYAKP
jgi:hypothetical protein